MTDDSAARDVAALVRDPRSSAQVWSQHGGYPGAAPYLEFHKIRWPGWAQALARERAGHGPGRTRRLTIPARRASSGNVARVRTSRTCSTSVSKDGASGGDVIVAPFDAELFGHWWFEGPDFLGDLYAHLPEFRGLRATTAGAHLDAHAPHVRAATRDWFVGRERRLLDVERPARRVDLADHLGSRGSVLVAGTTRHRRFERTHEILAQAARSMLLLQSSDWQFIISTGEVEDYAIRRFNDHAGDCARLLNALEDALDGKGCRWRRNRLARELQQRDDVFREIIPSIRAAISDQRSATTADIPTPAVSR